jgi:hypothetical protein
VKYPLLLPLERSEPASNPIRFRVVNHYASSTVDEISDQTERFQTISQHKGTFRLATNFGGRPISATNFHQCSRAMDGTPISEPICFGRDGRVAYTPKSNERHWTDYAGGSLLCQF